MIVTVLFSIISGCTPQVVNMPFARERIETYYSTITPTEYKGRAAVHIQNGQTKPDGAVLFFKDVTLGDCIIEVDIASERFAGVAFRGQNGDHYDKIYFRPFNSGTAKHENTVQYASHGTEGAGWQPLRKRFPGKYEAGADIPVWDWFHVKLVIEGQKVRAYVNDEKEPVLVVEKILSDQKQGKIGIWGWNAYFSNFSYKPLP